MNSDVQFSLPVTFLKEKKRYVAYTPALDLSTSGKTFDQARKRFEEIVKQNTIDEVLTDMGWTKIQKQWYSPVVISNQTETVPVKI